jgi:hypothetical protein
MYSNICQWFLQGAWSPIRAVIYLNDRWESSTPEDSWKWPTYKARSEGFAPVNLQSMDQNPDSLLFISKYLGYARNFLGIVRIYYDLLMSTPPNMA